VRELNLKSNKLVNVMAFSNGIFGVGAKDSIELIEIKGEMRKKFYLFSQINSSSDKFKPVKD
jgi:hypothetical protein